MTRSVAALCGFTFAALSACAYHSTKVPDEQAGADYAGRAVAGDIDRGKLVFATNCATCHGADGRSGGVGPSLIDENVRQNLARTIVWIENPAYPMPKLYPSPLSETDVEDVAAFVQNIR
ncbi:MAG: cytochrome c [Candidatus Eremiobacteraeota bacterium]|nr:cytochrome c [Candidatus Eremiobacteraeota bacterium]